MENFYFTGKKKKTLLGGQTDYTADRQENRWMTRKVNKKNQVIILLVIDFDQTFDQTYVATLY